jgi:tetratricopeptide (TPR) repeat protein
MRFLLLAICMFISSSVISQKNEKSFSDMLTQADSLYKKENYLAASEKYEKMITCFPDKISRVQFYNAARSRALAGNKEKAFHHLTKLLKNMII